MALVLLVYLSFAGYLIFTLPSDGLPMRFSRTIAEQQVRTDALPQLVLVEGACRFEQPMKIKIAATPKTAMRMIVSFIIVV